MPRTKTEVRDKKNVGGRPRMAAEPLTFVGFRADPATLDAIDRLAAALDVPGLALGNGTRSVAIRRALLESAARLSEQVKPLVEHEKKRAKSELNETHC